MSASEAAALTTRSRLRSNSKVALLHIHPEEELAKHENRCKPALKIPSSSMEIPTVHTRFHDHHHHLHHHHHPRREELSGDVGHGHDVSISTTRSKSKSRVLSYGPSCDDVAPSSAAHPHSMDSIASLEDANSTETQSSSKTVPLQADAHTNPHTMKLSALPSVLYAQLQAAASIFFTKDVLLHVICSLLLLGLVLLTVSHAGVLPVRHNLIKKFNGIGVFPGWKASLATSQQVEEMKENLIITLQVTAERLERRVEGLKMEMQEEMKKRRQEAEEIREEMSKRIEQADTETGKDDGLQSLDMSRKEYGYGYGYGSYGYGDQRPDYALASGGGRVVGHSLAYKPASTASWIESFHSFFIRSSHIHPSAPIILQPSFNQPGQCLPLIMSANAHVEVALRTPIFPDQVTLSHVSKSIAYDISSAPKDFQVHGLAPPLSTEEPSRWVLMGEFTYDVHKAVAAQTFPLWAVAKTTLTSTIKLQILSNYGSPSHTCIYRLQVHGKEKEPTES